MKWPRDILHKSADWGTVVGRSQESPKGHPQSLRSDSCKLGQLSVRASSLTALLLEPVVAAFPGEWQLCDQKSCMALTLWPELVCWLLHCCPYIQHNPSTFRPIARFKGEALAAISSQPDSFARTQPAILLTSVHPSANAVSAMQHPWFKKTKNLKKYTYKKKKTTKKNILMNVSFSRTDLFNQISENTKGQNLVSC